MTALGVGIHPRLLYRDGVKKNTCKPRSIGRLQRALAGVERHLETNPNDAMNKARAATLKRQIAGG